MLDLRFTFYLGLYSVYLLEPPPVVRSTEDTPAPQSPSLRTQRTPLVPEIHPLPGTTTMLGFSRGCFEMPSQEEVQSSPVSRRGFSLEAPTGCSPLTRLRSKTPRSKTPPWKSILEYTSPAAQLHSRFSMIHNPRPTHSLLLSFHFDNKYELSHRCVSYDLIDFFFAAASFVAPQICTNLHKSSVSAAVPKLPFLMDNPENPSTTDVRGV